LSTRYIVTDIAKKIKPFLQIRENLSDFTKNRPFIPQKQTKS